TRRRVSGSDLAKMRGMPAGCLLLRPRRHKILSVRSVGRKEGMSMPRFPTALLFVLAATTGAPSTAALGDDQLKLAVGAPNNWDSGVPDIGKRAGIFKKHGLDLDILYTNGGGETLQAVISGSVDLGIGAGTSSVLGAFAKGAPVRI